MGILYVVKEFGRYHFFKTEEERTAFLEGLTEWERKFAETYESRFGKVS
ncbi:MAG: hypothetical protein IKO36_10460 [Bacteroidaceae bacterium]|nr:hypothetical protein [Bacteroidaceae bacterium]